MASLRFSYIGFIMKGRKLLFQLISGVITIFVLYGLVSFVFLKCFATSLEPGWHTPIFPPKAFNLTNLTIIIIICSLLTCLIFKSLLWILIKIFSLHPNGQRTNG